MPSFWFSTGWKPDKYYYGSWNSESDSGENASNEEPTTALEPETKLRSNQLDRSVCQAIARTLWDIYPQMTIADMCKHEVIQRYGNGKLYKGEHTLRDWLSDVAPPEVKGKRGRRKKSET